jgi:hypothetical protein
MLVFILFFQTFCKKTLDFEIHVIFKTCVNSIFKGNTMQNKVKILYHAKFFFEIMLLIWINPPSFSHTPCLLFDISFFFFFFYHLR